MVIGGSGRGKGSGHGEEAFEPGRQRCVGLLIGDAKAQFDVSEFRVVAPVVGAGPAYDAVDLQGLGVHGRMVRINTRGHAVAWQVAYGGVGEVCLATIRDNADADAAAGGRGEGSRDGRIGDREGGDVDTLLGVLNVGNDCGRRAPFRGKPDLLSERRCGGRDREGEGEAECQSCAS